MGREQHGPTTVIDDMKLSAEFAKLWEALRKLEDQLRVIREMIEDRDQH